MLTSRNELGFWRALPARQNPDLMASGERGSDTTLPARGLGVVTAPTQWPVERRALSLDGRALRLSDHAPVEARFEKSEPPALAN